MLTTDTPIFNFPKRLLYALLILLTPGCNNTESIFVAQVISRPNCDGIQTGIAAATFTDVARIRGTELLEIVSEDKLSLFAVSAGQKPTSGHTITLASPDAQLAATSVIVEFKLEAPQGGVIAQMQTTPCTIIALRRPSGTFTHIEARTTSGDIIGQTELF